MKDDSEPVAFLIATHRDCVDHDKVDTVNDHLKHRIHSSAELFGEKLVHFSRLLNIYPEGNTDNIYCIIAYNTICEYR